MKPLLAMFFSTASRQPVWYVDFEKARKAASRLNKLMVLNFCGAGWDEAGESWKEELFDNDAFRLFAIKNLVLMNVDMNLNKIKSFLKPLAAEHKMLANKYNPEHQFPFTVLLDARGNELTHWSLSQQMSAEKCISDLTKIYFNQSSILRLVK